MSGYDYSKYKNAGDAVLEYFSKELSVGVFEKMGLLSDALHGAVVVFFTVALIGYGTLFVLNKVDGTKDDLIKAFIIAAVVSSLSPDVYMEMIVFPVLNISEGLTLFITNTDSPSIFESIDAILFSVIEYGFTMVGEGGVSDFIPIVAGSITIVTFGYAYALFAIAVIFANFMISIVFMFGFILIKLCVFKAWRPVFKTWVQSVLKFSFVPVLASTIIVFSANLVKNVMDGLIEKNLDPDVYVEDLMNSNEYWIIILTGIVCAYAMSKVIETAAELTGGVANDLGGATRGAASSAMATARGAGIASKASGKFGVQYAKKKFGG